MLYVPVKNQYDGLAFVYDRLSRMLGRSYRESKFALLEVLQPGYKVLYLGGGTGENLPAMLERIGDSGKLVYVEASERMIEKARSSVGTESSSRLIFLHQADFEPIPLDQYNIVVTQYLLDILEDRDLAALAQAVNKRTDVNSRWIFVDFFPVKKKRYLLGLMILFFRIFTRNPRKGLPDYSEFFSQSGWTIMERVSYEGGFIQAWLMGRGG